MAVLNLVPLDELIHARRTLHGGTKGAPIKLIDGTREGDAINRACIVALSGALQNYVEQVFTECSNGSFRRLVWVPAEEERYKVTWKNWGNPNSDNIDRLFRRLGIDSVLAGLSWRKQTNETWRANLNRINHVRNCIAHGSPLTVSKRPYSLTFSTIIKWRNSSEQFGLRFHGHAIAKVI
ncbi:HEPN domain-containing protein [Sulfitobacter sp.]|uniref:HEPN domain-containing protein n=1 Tax=Sulfitobacter sp. TaxID=1903071 RepID=UPI003EFB3B01